MDQDGFALYDGFGMLKAHMDPGTGQLRIYSTGDVTHTSTEHGLQVGPTNGQNLVVDDNEIMSRLNGDEGQLLLNREGGEVLIGGKVGGFDETDPADDGVIPATDNHRIYLRPQHTPGMSAPLTTTTNIRRSWWGSAAGRICGLTITGSAPPDPAATPRQPCTSCRNCPAG